MKEDTLDTTYSLFLPYSVGLFLLASHIYPLRNEQDNTRIINNKSNINKPWIILAGLVF